MCDTRSSGSAEAARSRHRGVRPSSVRMSSRVTTRYGAESIKRMTSASSRWPSAVGG
jgi:hypothetical protein